MTPIKARVRGSAIFFDARGDDPGALVTRLASALGVTATKRRHWIILERYAFVIDGESVLLAVDDKGTACFRLFANSAIVRRKVLERIDQGSDFQVEHEKREKKLTPLRRGAEIPQYDLAEFARFIARFDEATMQACLSELVQRYDSASFVAPDYAPLLANHIRERIAAGRPMSAVRLGDGEGNMLAAADPDFPDLLGISAIRTVSRQFAHWFSPSIRQDICRLVTAATEDADIVGLPIATTLRAVYRKAREANTCDAGTIRGMTGTIDALRIAHALLSNHPEKRIITTWFFNRDLLPFYPDILGGLKRIGLISCYLDLPRRIRARFGVGQVDFYPIPNQASNLGRRPAESHYPERFSEIMQSLKVAQEGQVFLVAAGVLGKVYCQRVKELGGIGIDIGSMADVWSGKSARTYQTEAYLERWKL